MKKAVRILLVAAASSGSVLSAPNADDFLSFLNTADCTFLEADHAIDLRVLDMKFSLAKGFFFAGHEAEGVTFRKNSDLSPLEYMQQNPDVPPKDVVSILSAQQASVVYTNAEQEGGLADPDNATFESLEWNGLSLLYRSSVGGRQVETTTHQVIVLDATAPERLLITASDPANIAAIVACATEIE